MKRKRIITIITLILIILITVLIIKNINIEKNKKDEYQEYTPQEEISEEQTRQTKITLYFENVETGELDTEIKIVDANILINNPEKELIDLLIKGPQSSNLRKIIPEGTIVHEVKIDKSCAIINVSSEFLNYESDENKSKLINSIVNTLTNLKEINSIKFLINGEENEKLPDIYVKNN